MKKLTYILIAVIIGVGGYFFGSNPKGKAVGTPTVTLTGSTGGDVLYTKDESGAYTGLRWDMKLNGQPVGGTLDPDELELLNQGVALEKIIAPYIAQRETEIILETVAEKEYTNPLFTPTTTIDTKKVAEEKAKL